MYGTRQEGKKKGYVRRMGLGAHYRVNFRFELDRAKQLDSPAPHSLNPAEETSLFASGVALWNSQSSQYPLIYTWYLRTSPAPRARGVPSSEVSCGATSLALL